MQGDPVISVLTLVGTGNDNTVWVDFQRGMVIPSHVADRGSSALETEAGHFQTQTVKVHLCIVDSS